ncbi:toxin [Pseudohongiella spirulinae]|uniref:Toxin n=1 Tax=Pseudohongiella spirulinae TaxID=1249552 RepID=A0A0S2KF23_9GAMM|nr:toxin [Pseudohongiella spirulinae]
MIIFPSMKIFSWDNEKNKWLIAERGVSFERIVFLIENNALIDLVRHPNSDKYPSQRMFIVEIDNYAWLVPFVESDHEIFLKTAIPSRKATKKYLGGDV